VLIVKKVLLLPGALLALVVVVVVVVAGQASTGHSGFDLFFGGIFARKKDIGGITSDFVA
jgi:hypothetical protein